MARLKNLGFSFLSPSLSVKKCSKPTVCANSITVGRESAKLSSTNTLTKYFPEGVLLTVTVLNLTAKGTRQFCLDALELR
jgi:hypothetical protein